MALIARAVLQIMLQVHNYKKTLELHDGFENRAWER
jgi:hypothetical protein